MFAGERINITEDRSVLHVALRMPRGSSLVVDGVDVVAEVHDVLDRMAAFSGAVRSGEWKGFTGLPIRNVVNIGIGGSDLGPVMAYRALRHYSRRDMTFRFVSNIDGTDFVEATRDLNAAETLFVVCSKTFTTLETMTNAATARAWLLDGLGGDESAVARHFVAVSTNLDGVSEFGIDPANAFGFWDWVGGRYSMDSAIGLSTMLAIGPEGFERLLAGFHAMDEHFRTAPLAGNMPVLMGLLGVWYSDFFGSQTAAVLPYDQYLERFPAYLQQLTMESNGKSTRIDSSPVAVDTGADLLGRARNERSAQLLPAHSPGYAADPVRLHLLRGEPQPGRQPPRPPRRERVRAGRGARVREDRPRTVAAEGNPEWLVPHRTFPGNRPSNVLMAERLTPEVLGRARGAVRAQRVRAGRDLVDQLVRPVGRRAREGAGAADRAGARGGRRARPRARRVDERADPTLSRVAAERGATAEPAVARPRVAGFSQAPERPSAAATRTPRSGSRRPCSSCGACRPRS